MSLTFSAFFIRLSLRLFCLIVCACLIKLLNVPNSLINPAAILGPIPGTWEDDVNAKHDECDNTYCNASPAKNFSPQEYYPRNHLRELEHLLTVLPQRPCAGYILQRNIQWIRQSHETETRKQMAQQIMQQHTVNSPLFYHVIMINTTKVHRINHMHARANSAAPKRQSEVSRSISKKRTPRIKD